MSKVKIEAFFSTSNDSNDASLSRLLEEIKMELGNKIEIFAYTGENKLFKEYSLTATPAVVIEEIIKMMGFCPSKETLVSAVKDAGLE
ncbi:MAG: thioredoxin family protein [Dehalococcoidia bacterium]